MGSRAFVSKLVQDVRASYWFLPTSLVCLALLVSQGALFFDRNPGMLPFDLPKAFQETHVDGARALMSIIAQSIFGVAGVLFSMTIAAVSFASGNFGPRLIGNFMRDRGNQWSLGILIATFVFALMVLRAIQGTEATGGDAAAVFVPHLSILLALVAAFISVFTVIYFVHHIPETINVSNITAALGRKLVREVKAEIVAQGAATEAPAPLPKTEPDACVTLSDMGYIQALNTKDLNNLAEKHGLLIEVKCPIGTFVTHDTVVMRIWGEAASDEDVCAEICTAFALGASPTEEQNLLFIVDQLVEMIARAMSPGMNDPFTAINCLNWLHAAAVTAANYKGGLKGRADGAVRLGRPEFGDILRAGFGAAYPYFQSDALCLKHVTGIFKEARAQIEDKAHRATLDAFVGTLSRDEA